MSSRSDSDVGVLSVQQSVQSLSQASTHSSDNSTLHSDIDTKSTNMITYEMTEPGDTKTQSSDKTVPSDQCLSSGDSSLSDSYDNRASHEGSSGSANVSSDESDEDEKTNEDEEGSLFSSSSDTMSDTSLQIEQDFKEGHALISSTIANKQIFLTEPADSFKTSNLSELLFKAIEQGDIETVKHLLKEGASVKFYDKHKRTPLHIACSLGHLVIVQLLTSSGSNVDACSLNKQTPLHEACIGGHVKIIQLLIPEVADLDYVDHLGRSAAHYCALHGEVNCLNLLCNQGSDICLEDNFNRTGVHLAAIKNHPSIIQCLMERGAEIESTDCEGKTPAHYAAQYGSLDCLSLLLKSAVDITQGDLTGSQPAHEAASHDQVECLKVLLKRGAKCSDVDHKGRNIIHQAAQSNAVDCLHWILATGRLGPNTTDYAGNTGLHFAAAGGHSEAYHCLLQHGANSGIHNKDGNNPLDVARRHGKPQAISKAIDGLRKCKWCANEEKLRDKQAMSQSSSIKLKMSASKETLFTLQPSSSRSLGCLRPKRSQGEKPFTKKTVISTNSSHIVATKYYGPFH